MSSLFTMCACGRNKIPHDAPHQRCVQCLGLEHLFDICPECVAVNRSNKARRTLQLNAWKDTGTFTSRAKAAAYFKQSGTLDVLRLEISASFSSTVEDS